MKELGVLSSVAWSSSPVSFSGVKDSPLAAVVFTWVSADILTNLIQDGVYLGREDGVQPHEVTQESPGVCPLWLPSSLAMSESKTPDPRWQMALAPLLIQGQPGLLGPGGHTLRFQFPVTNPERALWARWAVLQERCVSCCHSELASALLGTLLECSVQNPPTEFPCPWASVW